MGDQFERIRLEPDGPAYYLEHRDGIDWLYAPKPWRFHRCRPQTRGWVGWDHVQRCACGAIRLREDYPWMDRNSKSRAVEFTGQWAIRLPSGELVGGGLDSHRFLVEILLERCPTGSVIVHRTELGGPWQEASAETSGRP